MLHTVKKLVRVETVNPSFGAMPNRQCEVLKSHFHDGVEWYKLRDISSGTVFHSPEIFWVADAQPLVSWGLPG
jgi:hypothetical protein